MTDEAAVRIHRLSADGFDRAAPALGALLAETVAGGASLGFRMPFAPADAAAWWRGQAQAVRSGALVVWTASDESGGAPGHLLGTVGLAFNTWANGGHRADVVKLMVHRDARGRGLGRTLLRTAEEYAAATGITLLMLDTEAESPAERLYAAAGWTRYGIVPGYAADPSGALRDCTFFYKPLGGDSVGGVASRGREVRGAAAR
ncbi:GNAT family N-acetyltransferase [Yinghuangia sp. YIM S09857]|uniref:GNAT family N-acetyltransferase n=1 Tax=Yinghuangia sp. YIM S09857 TaxID=3436929 RepID=UPI003F53AC26